MAKPLTFRSVFQRMQDETALIDLNTHLKRAMRLIHHACFETYTASVLQRKTVELEVKDGRAELPCDAIRLLTVRGINQSRGADCGYDANGYVIKMLGMKTGEIQARYYGADSVVDQQTGHRVPVIHRQQIDYCCYYALVPLVRDLVGMGKMPAVMLQSFEAKCEGAWYDAVGSEDTISLDDFEEMKWVMRNGIYFNRPNFNPGGTYYG